MNTVLRVLPYYWKAVLAFIAPGAVVIGSAAEQGPVSGRDWVVAAVASITTSAGVAWAENAPREQT